MRREDGPGRSPARLSGRRLVLVCLLAACGLGWSGSTVRWVAWSAVEFYPPDLARQVRRYHERYDAGIQRGLSAPPAWRAAAPGRLREALTSQVERCATSLRRPVPMADLVEEIGVLAVRVLDANDPVAVGHSDVREVQYAGSYVKYVDSLHGRLRLVYYGQDPSLALRGNVDSAVTSTLARSEGLYPFVGQEFFRTGTLRDWHELDDRSVAFGVAAISLSWGLTDLANFTSWVWRSGGGLVPTPRPTPPGHVGPTITLPLSGGFPERTKAGRGAPAMPPSRLTIPPP
jgi:hypothetical protein